MPKDLKDLPRPPNDNGRGLHGCASIGWSGGSEGYDYWIGELVAMGIKWFKVLDDGGDSVAFCEKLLAAGIFPIVRIIRKDPPPNDTPEPNPGHIGAAEEQTIQRLISAGVRYFETNNEPDLGAEWKHNAIPGNPLETAKLVALNWLFDARFILDAGGLPGLPAVSGGSSMDLMGALVSLGHQDILLEGCWIALHNYCLNHPLQYPDDPINRSGQPLSPDKYNLGAYTQWVWWNGTLGRANTIDEVNTARAVGKNPTQTILEDHSCFREFEYFNALAMKYLGRSIAILSTEGGYRIGHREDPRYGRVTPESHRDMTVALFDYVQRQAPEYYLAAVPWLLIETAGWQRDAWNSSFWQRALRAGGEGREGIPPVPVPGIGLGDHLPVVDAVKGMANIPRRSPGVQPAPPVQPPVVISTRPAPVSPAEALAPVPRLAPEKLVQVPVTTPPESAPPVLPRPPSPAPVRAPIAVPPTPPPAPVPSRPAISVTTAQSPAPARPTFSETIHAKYVVLPGDTLSKLATQFKTTPEHLVELNQLTLSGTIQPGQILLIPVPTSTPLPPMRSTTPPNQPEAATAPAAVAPSFTPSLPPRQPQTPVSTPPTWQAATPPRLSGTLEPAVDWDPRLDALRITLDPALVVRGQTFWRLVRAEYQGPDESDGKHHIIYRVLDERGQPLPDQKVWQGWAEDRIEATTNAQGETSIPLWASFAPDVGETGPYFAWVDGLPSDRVNGMGMPLKRKANFLLTWQRAVA